MTRTLADMTPAEQDQCVGMWFELLGASYPVILASPDDPYDGFATVMVPGTGKTTYTPERHLTPRYDLPRAWTPSGEPPAGEWDDDQGKNLMRRWASDWEWKHDTPQHIRDEHERKA